MKKDIEQPVVEDVSLAIVVEKGEEKENIYTVYLINEKQETLEQVMVTSKGYVVPANKGKEIKTGTLRKALGNVAPNSTQMIEPILEEVLKLNNEFWVSFWIGNTMYDKKYIFLAESVIKSNFMTIPLLEKQGVLIG